ncbi:MAG: M15 family metallopeptidase [Candidatus Obscuribacterales bacterium]|nr:M15 family metallopeptidase [Candidatus Obscuribacterales bacterium]
MTSSIFRIPEQLDIQMRSTQIWRPECPVHIDRLARVPVEFIDFESVVHRDGEIIVFDAVAERVSRIFQALFEMRFPIHRARSLHHYQGDDDLSMADNNSSCFNFRPIAGSSTVSMHGYGLALDINPLQNPFVRFDEKEGTARISPLDGWQYLNRRNQKPGMVESIVQLFADNGFNVWGGSWTTPIDYHHFQPPRMVANILADLNLEEGREFFELWALNHSQLAGLEQKLGEEPYAFFRSNRANFMVKLQEVLS